MKYMFTVSKRYKQLVSAPGVCFRQSLDLACVSLQRPTLVKRKKKETFQSKSDYILEEYYRRDVQAESVDISQYFEFSQGK